MEDPAGLIGNEMGESTQDIEDPHLTYDEMARETEILQQRCMELSQENNAMKKEISAKALMNPDLRSTFVGSTPYYPNRGRGQAFRGT